MINEYNCFYCGADEDEKELRPYGPGGSGLCVPCMEVDPEREAEAKAVFYVQCDAAEAISPHDIVILEGRGPQPYYDTGR